MQVFDIEAFLDQFEKRMKVALPAAIAQINLEKGEDLVPTISEDAWIAMSLDDRVKNFTDFVFYFLDDVQAEASGPSLAEELTVEIDIFLADPKDNKQIRRILRAQRALKEAVVMAWEKIGRGYDRAEITTLTPIGMELDGSGYVDVVGVSLKFSINS